MKPIRVLLIDDEPPARRKLRRLLSEHPALEVIGEAENGESAIAAIEEEQPDLLFLDIQMPDMDGFSVLSALKSETRPYVIFLTAHNQYALRAFEYQAFDYLLKPISPTRFEGVVKRTLAHFSLLQRAEAEHVQPPVSPAVATSYPKRLLVNANERSLFLPVETIDLVEAEKNYVRLVTKETSYLQRGTLESMAAKLDPEEFVQVNRSTIVRLEAIASLDSWFHGEYRIHLWNGRELVWSRRFIKRAPFHLLPQRSSQT